MTLSPTDNATISLKLILKEFNVPVHKDNIGEIDTELCSAIISLVQLERPLNYTFKIINNRVESPELIAKLYKVTQLKQSELVKCNVLRLKAETAAAVEKIQNELLTRFKPLNVCTRDWAVALFLYKELCMINFDGDIAVLDFWFKNYPNTFIYFDLAQNAIREYVS
jgi:hypothetical protein